MKLRVLGCYGGNVRECGMTSFLVNDTVCLDAGFVSGALSLREQVKVKDVVIAAPSVYADRRRASGSAGRASCDATAARRCST